MKQISYDLDLIRRQVGDLSAAEIRAATGHRLDGDPSALVKAWTKRLLFRAADERRDPDAAAMLSAIATIADQDIERQGIFMEVNASATIDAITSPLQPGDLPDDISCHVLGSKFIKGGEPVDGTCPLAVALLEKWPVDVHLSMYTSPSSVRCIKSSAGDYDLQFDYLMYDLDFDAHQSRPTIDDFA